MKKTPKASPESKVAYLETAKCTTYMCECGCKHFYVWDSNEVECIDCYSLTHFTDLEDSVLR